MADTYFDPKDPADQATYTLDFALDLAVGETITACTVSSTTISGGLSTLSVTPTATVSGSKCSTFIMGGAANQEYQVTYRMTTSFGNVVSRSVLLPVQNR